MKQKSSVLVAYGSNLGDRNAHIQSAIQMLQNSECNVTTISQIYTTSPMGAADQPFYNGALICETTLDPFQFMQFLLEVEKKLGRVRTIKWGNRTIDLDILLWRTAEGQSLVIESTDLTIPHLEMNHRDFVLLPANEIAADWFHPVVKLTIKEIYASFRGHTT